VSTFLALATAGIVSGCVYALTASGLVLTYTTSGVFNFAHGAIGMTAAFTYWELTVSRGLPALPALLLTVLVLAPLLGFVIERVLLRRLAGAPVEVSLTVTVGLLLLLIGTANTLWPPTTPHRVRAFFLGHDVTVFGVVLTVHQLIVVGSAVVVAAGLWLFLHRSRMGITMRAVVDDRELAALSAASPNRVGMLGFALGSSLAALAGVLLASQVQLNAVTMTLVVINGYAAAVVGRLRNLPLTFVGALVLGLLQAMAVGYLSIGWLSQVQPVIPMVFLFGALLVVPHARLRTAGAAMLRAPRVASARSSVLAAAALVVVAGLAATALPHGQVATLCHGTAVALVLLSLVPLTGYGGQVSLCQLSFAGIGAVVMARADGGSGSLWALLAAIAVPAAVGALVALPALRLRGLYLALATLAFAYAMEGAFFGNASVMTDSLSLRVPRPHLGVSLADNRVYLVAVAATFAVCGCGVLALRRSSLGRRLVAMGDSPTGATTIGIGLGATKLGVFALSAGIAGLGGALLGGEQGAVSNTDFGLVLSLTLLLLAVIWGIKTVTGVLLAGLFLEVGPLLQDALGQVENIVPLLVGLGAIGIGTHQNGLVGGVLNRLQPSRQPSRPDTDAEGPNRTQEEVLAGASS
jgi:branched-chain amino acid transport system permease protein